MRFVSSGPSSSRQHHGPQFIENYLTHWSVVNSVASLFQTVVTRTEKNNEHYGIWHWRPILYLWCEPEISVSNASHLNMSSLIPRKSFFFTWTLRICRSIPLSAKWRREKYNKIDNDNCINVFCGRRTNDYMENDIGQRLVAGDIRSSPKIYLF